LAAFQAGSGGISGRRCCIVTIVRRNKKGYSLKAPDLNTKPAPRCLHISFSDIIVKFVNHITLPYAEAPVHPVLHFFAFLSEGNRKIALVKRKYPVEKIQELFPVNRKC
jgi:hypothetical protein